MLNDIYKTLAAFEKEKDFIDLIDTNFTSNGFIYPAEKLKKFFDKYLKNRKYEPNSKGLASTRKSISGFYNTSGIDISEDNILITASTSESYGLIFNNFTEPGDNVLLPSPGYPLFEYLAGYSHIEAKYYSLDFSNGWDIDFDSLEKAVNPKTKIIVLISPNNPTGTTLSIETLKKITAFAEKNNLIIISDEVFSEFYFSKDKLPRVAALSKKVLIFTLNGISKMFTLPDMKLAWTSVTGPTKKVTDALEKLEISNDTFLNANYLSQSILPDLFKESKEFQSQMISQIDKNRKWVIEFFDGSNKSVGREIFKFVSPTSGIHMFINLPGIKASEQDFVIDLIKKEHLFLHPGYFYDYDNPNVKGVNVVISFLKEKKAFQKGLKKLKEFILLK